MIGSIAAQVIQVVTEANARQALLDSMPKAEADKRLAEDAIKTHQNKLHDRALEIAEAGRARNFWGN